MGSSGNETVNDNEMGKDVDETLNINLNDSLAEGEAKGPPLSHPGDGEAQKSTEDRELKTMDRVNVTKDAIDKKISAAELIPSENVSEIPDVKSAETIVDDAGKASTDGNVQENATRVIVNGAHNEHEDVKMNSMDNVGEGPDEVIMDVDAKENEASQLHLLDEKSSPAKFVGDDKVKDDESGKAVKDVVTEICVPPHTRIKEEMPKPKVDEDHETLMNTPSKSFLAELSSVEGYESGTEEKQATFAKEVETFYRENNFEYKAPKFYKEELNLLKLWRAVIKLGGYEQVTSCKLWRQVGESFKPPKTCTTVSWTFRIFYEKALLEYEKHKMRNGELPFSDDSLTEPIRVENQTAGSQALGSGRARRDAAARAMQGWHSQRLLGNGEVCQPIIKDKNLNSTLKSEKQLKTNGVLKRKKPSNVERAVLVPHMKTVRPQMDSMVIDIGPPADWVKINVQRTNDCFEIYALVPGLLREEVHVQSDPAGRLIISGQPEQLDNPWGVTPFKKVVSLPSRIDPHQTSAVVTLHGQLFVRVPFEQSDI